MKPIFPEIIDLAAILEKNFDFEGANVLKDAICKPIEPKFEKPHKAYVTITALLSFRQINT